MNDGNGVRIALGMAGLSMAWLVCILLRVAWLYRVGLWGAMRSRACTAAIAVREVMMAKSVGKVEVFRGKDQQWYFRTRAANGRIGDVSEGYTRRRDAVRGARRWHPGVPLVMQASAR